MLHFTCDLCGQALNDERFVVKLEVFSAGHATPVTEADVDEDHLQALADALDEAVAGEVADEASSRSFRFDLCPACRKRYVKDPLGRSAARRMNFSQN